MSSSTALATSFASALHTVLDSVPSDEAQDLLGSLDAALADPVLIAQIELALSQTLATSLPRQPPNGSLRRLWDELRCFVESADVEALVGAAFKPTTVHIMAEQFNLGHVSQGKRVRVFKKQAGFAPAQPSEDPNWDSEHRMYFETVKRFISNKDMATFNFPPYLSSEQREKVHRIAGLFPDIDHDTFGSKSLNDRYVRLTKVDHARERRVSLVASALESPRQAEGLWDVTRCTTSPSLPDSVRFASMNVMWMDVALDTDVERCAALGDVIRDLNPTVLCIQEGPSSVERMQSFVADHLDGAFQVFGGLEELRQQIFVLVRRDSPIQDPQLHQPAMQFLSRPWQFDLNGDRVLLPYKFCRRPVCVRATLHGQPLFVVGVHMKSMKISNGEQLCRADMDKFIERSIKNRRRIGAECYRVRQCLERVISPPGNFVRDPHIVVMGDLNTGPGRDFFERFYLLFDVLDVLQGSPFDHTKKLYAPLLNDEYVKPSERWSAEFRDCMDGQLHVRLFLLLLFAALLSLPPLAPLQHVLVDHIFVSRALRRGATNAGIAHDIFMRHKSPSDHRPAFIDVQVTPRQDCEDDNDQDDDSVSDSD